MQNLCEDMESVMLSHNSTVIFDKLRHRAFHHKMEVDSAGGRGDMRTALKSHQQQLQFGME